MHDTKKRWAIPPSRVTAPYCHYKTSLLEGKMQYFGREKSWSTRASEIFHGEHSNLQLSNTFLYASCWSLGPSADSCLRVSCLIYNTMMEWPFKLQNRARVLNKKIIHCTTSTKIPILVSSLFSLPSKVFCFKSV